MTARSHCPTGCGSGLAIATALAARRRAYIFDEPTSGVGYSHLRTITQIMRELADGGAVVIVIAHDIELVNEVADHVVELPDKAVTR